MASTFKPTLVSLRLYRSTVNVSSCASDCQKSQFYSPTSMPSCHWTPVQNSTLQPEGCPGCSAYI
eukprot:1160452-Pelagomonas_calceolata.AAC.6